MPALQADLLTAEQYEMLRRASRQQAVVTISTPSFVPGTLLMWYTFRRYNPWFEGELIVLVDQASEAMQRHLSLLPKVRLHQVGRAILEPAQALADADRTGRIFASHYWSIELFNLSGYDRLFYVDSDMLILGSFHELFLRSEPMLVVGDAFHYKGKLRSGADYREYTPKIWSRRPPKSSWDRCFNAGLILFDGSWAEPKRYRELCAMIHSNYSAEAMRLQDQMIQNVYFRGQYELVSGRYNFRLGMAEQIQAKDGVGLDDAVVIHYTARKKPWLHHEALDRLVGSGIYFQAFQSWQQHWLELAQWLHQQNFGKQS